MNKYQSLSEFLLHPFHIDRNVDIDNTYESKYKSFVSGNKIKLTAACKIEDSYYLHVKIPSESKKDNKYEYDVVIRFFTEDPIIAVQPNIRAYNIQFFSNSPSFMYKYAYLYNKHDYLIKALYNKLDADYINIPPEKTNANMRLGYDSSIYCACRYLSDTQFRYLTKNGVLLMKMVNERKFFNDISDFKSIKLDQVILTEERKVANTLKQNKGRGLFKKSEGKKEPVKPLGGRKGISVVKKKTGSKSIVSKKTATRSTTKR